MVKRPSVRPFVRTGRDTWLNPECTGYLCSCILPSCRLPLAKGGHDYILGKSSTRFVRWALRWRRGVFAVNVTCPKGGMPFRTSHVGRCKLLSGMVQNDPHIHEDMAVFRSVLPDNYSIIDAALNHQSVGGFCYLIEHLCMVLKVPLDEV